MDTPSLVFQDWLYLGSYSSTRNETVIRQLGITHIFSAIGEESDPFTDIIYASIDIEDDSSQELNKAISQCNQFILSARKSSNSKILIHCAMGMSRAPSLVLAYLIIYHRLSLEAAFLLVQTARPQISPHYEFREQLRRLERRIIEQDEDPVKADLIRSFIEPDD